MKKLILPCFFGIFLLVIISTLSISDAQVVTEPSFQTINLVGRPNTNDFPYGITCNDSSYIYLSLFSQGALARVSRSDGTVTFFDNNSVGSGEDWYSLVTDPTSGKIFANEKDNGKLRVFNPSSSSFTVIPVIKTSELSALSITYNQALNTITYGSTTQNLGFSSFGELKYTNSHIWQVLDYTYNLDTLFSTTGLGTFSFHGVVKINPSTESVVSYHPISGASALRGIDVDESDSTILWITDNTNNKLFRFNTSTGLVTDTIDLGSGASPRGLADDSANVYVAMNQAGGSGNTKIMKVAKSNFVTSVLDTGTSNSNGGAFSVYIVNGVLFWTDQSSHIGTINLSDTSVKTVSSTSGTTDANHFACVEGNTVRFAGKGSTVIGSYTVSGISDSSSNHGDSCMGDCYAPHLGNDENSRFFYDDGLKINDRIFEVKNILHNIVNETLVFPVGEKVDFELKVQDSYPDNVSSCEIAFGIEKGRFVKQSASFIIGVKRTFDGVVSNYYEGDMTAFRDVVSSMKNIDENVIVKISFIPTKNIQHDMFAIECKDIHRYYTTYFFNHGIKFNGISEVGTPIFDYVDDDGIIHSLTILDNTLENMNVAVDENGNIWYGDFGKLWSKEFIRPDMTGSLSKYHGYDRNDYFEFKAYKIGQELLARDIFDSDKIQQSVKPSFAYKLTFYDRLHNPVPNMMKAIGEYEKSKLTNIVK